MTARTILITGATGLIGKHLVRKLNARGDVVLALSTRAASFRGQAADLSLQKAVGWTDYLSLKDEKIFGIINLAGKNLAEDRWTEKVKQEIYDSRIGTTTKLNDLISKMEIKPEVLVSASGVDYYGDKGDFEVDEDSPPGETVAAKVCVAWEKEAMKAEQYGVRAVSIRTGLVLASDSPAINKMMLPFRLLVGGPPGGGKQWLSWIHIDDITNAYIFALENKNVRGPINGSSPNPVRMKEFCKVLGRAIHRPSYMPVPKFVLKLAFGEVSELVLVGRRAVPKKLMKAGFRFRLEKVEEALEEVVNR
jgi:uncharacterized protein (TIGR01777 family)